MMKGSVSSTGTTTNAKPSTKPTKVTFQKPTQPPNVNLNTSSSHAPVIGTFSLPAGVGAGQPKMSSQNNFATSLTNGVSSHVTTSQSPDQPSTTDGAGIENTENLANTKEKTPMCLINELARFNRVTHQYTLVDEQGPAHKKTFFVKLQIGEREVYSASGPSIKKAQHSAAAIALEKSEYKHPPPKPLHRKGEPLLKATGESTSMTPTVELNALAMKRGEPACYRNIENGPHHMFYAHSYDFRGMYNQRYHYMRPPRTFYVSLKVGSREFIGEGISRQMARHNAAKKALDILRSLQIPDGGEVTTNGPSGTTAVDISGAATETSSQDGDNIKSEISVVHEIALRHNLPVTFDVVRESGPPHMKNFVTQCIVGTFKTEADGNSKKLSKKRAAELMLIELRNMPSPPQFNLQRPKTKPLVNKKKNRNLIKMQKADPTYGVGINPISRLIQIQQAQKKKEPMYSLVVERGLPRRREFVMQVQVEEHVCSGVGPNKKLAKRHAAEAMLQLLGYNKPSPQPSKPAIKMQGDTSLSEKKVTFSDSTEEQNGGDGSRKMVPGLLILPDGKRNNYTQLKGTAQYSSSGGKTGSTSRPEQQLCELCVRHNIEIKFDEFSGANNSNEFLSRLTITSTPPHTLHGSGSSPEAARDAAATQALKILEDVGLLKEGSPVNSLGAAGDGP